MVVSEKAMKSAELTGKHVASSQLLTVGLVEKLVPSWPFELLYPPQHSRQPLAKRAHVCSLNQKWVKSII